MKRFGIFRGIFVFCLLVFSLLISIPSNKAAISYDRATARSWACANNNRDGSFHGNPTEGRYSPTYVANMLYAGGIDVSGVNDPNSIVGNHQIQNWMRANPSHWEAVSDITQLEAGDFLLFSGSLPPVDVDSVFEHSAVFLEGFCDSPGGNDIIATWNNERMDIIEDDVAIVGSPPPVAKQATLYVHIIDNTPPSPPTVFNPADAATGVSIDIQLTWSGASDPDAGAVLSYTVRFAPNATPGTKPAYTALAIIEPATTSTTSNPPDYSPPRLNNPGVGLMPNTEYCWHITVADEHGASNDTAPVNCFTTIFVTAPSNLRMADNSLDSISLRWQDNSNNESDFYLEYSLTNNGTDWQGLPGEHVNYPIAANATTFGHLGLNCETVYYHRLRAYNATEDLFSSYSNVTTINTRPCAFPGVELLFPLNNAQILPVDEMPAFEFLAGSIATDYRIIIRYNNAGATIAYTSPPLTEAPFSEAAYCPNNYCTIDLDVADPSFPGLPFGTYTWEVVAYRLERYASTERRLFTLTPYTIPQPIGPMGQVTDSRGDIIYSWVDTGAPEYHLAVYTGTTPIAPIVTVSNTNCSASVCSYQPSNYDSRFYLRVGVSYKWGVASAGPEGISPESTRVSFSLFSSTALTVPVPISPNGSIEGARPIFIFSPQALANEYEIQIYRGTTLLPVVRYIYHNQYCDATDCEFELPADRALRNGSYTWTVRIVGSPNGSSAFYMPRLAFTVSDAAPPDPVLVSPVPDAELQVSRPEFVWEVADGALSYRLKIYRGTTLWRPPFPVDLSYCDASECGYTINVDLPEDVTNLSWEVEAINLVDTGLSERRNFSTNFMPESITLVTPAPNANLQDKPVLFSWVGDSRISSYQLKVFRVGNSTPFFNQPLSASDVCVLTDCSYSMDLADGNYQWLVEITIGTTVRSDKLGFTVDAVPNNLVLVNPINNLPISTISPDLIWQGDNRIVRYELRIVKTSNNDIMRDTVSFDAATVCTGLSCHYDMAVYNEKIPNSGTMRWTLIGYTVDDVPVTANANFVIQNILPASITLINPANGFISPVNNVNLEWSFDSRVEVYTLTITKPDATSEDIVITSCGATCIYPLSLDMIGTWRWSVVASKAGFDETVTSGSRNLSYQSSSGLPSTIQLYRPTNTSNTTDLDPILQWRHVVAVEEYRVIVIENSSNIEVFNSDWLSASSFVCATYCAADMSTFAAVLPNLGRYRWHVEARNSASTDTSSSVEWAFNLQNPLVGISLLSPGSASGAPQLNPATRTPTFVWRHNPVYNEYLLNIYDTSGTLIYTSPWTAVTSGNCPSDCSWALTDLGLFQLPSDGRYSFTVEGRRTGFNGQRTSNRYNFTLQNYAPVIQLELPELGHVYNGPSPAPVFSWLPNGLYDHYQLVLFNGTQEIWRSPDIDSTSHCAAVCAYNFGVEGYVIPVQSTNLKWQVVGFIAGYGSTGASVQRGFSAINLTPTGKPDLISPANNAPIYDPNVTDFAWEDLGYDNYILYVRQGTSGNNVIYSQPYDDSHCDGATCTVFGPIINFVQINGDHSWSVVGYMDGMLPNLNNRSAWRTLDVEMLPVMTSADLKAPRPTVAITLIDPVFYWVKDTNNRVDTYVVEVERVYSSSNIVLIQRVEITDVASICPATHLAIPNPTLYCGLVISNEDLQFEHNGNYRWRLILKRSEYDTEVVVGPVSFSMSIKPPVPNLIEPADRADIDLGAIGGASNFIFSWDGDLSGRVSEYELRLYSSTGERLTTNTAHNRFIAYDIDAVLGICEYEFNGTASITCSVTLAQLETIRPIGNEMIYWEVAAINSAFRDENAVVSIQRSFFLGGTASGTQGVVLSESGSGNIQVVTESPEPVPVATETVTEAATEIVVTETATETATEASTEVIVTETETEASTEVIVTETGTEASTEVIVTETGTEASTEVIATETETELATEIIVTPEVTEAVVLPTVTPIPTETPLATQTIEPLPTSAPIFPVVRVSYLGLAEDGISQRLSLEICTDLSYTVCEAVVSVVEGSTGQLIVPVEQIDTVSVYQLIPGTYLNLQLTSLSYTVMGLEISSTP